LAVEIDGGQHADPENISTDEIRTWFLNEKGIKMLRFWNHEVLRSLDDVVDEVLRNIKAQQDNEPG
jgi:very-short-patch-repair endonuclease